MTLKSTKNNPNPIPFYIKLEAVSDDENLGKKCNSPSLSSPIKTLMHCCNHERKLEEFKLESSRTLQMALKTKIDQIRQLSTENKKLVNNQKMLLFKMNFMKIQMQKYIRIRKDESSESEQENYNYFKHHKRNKQFGTNRVIKDNFFLNYFVY